MSKPLKIRFRPPANPTSADEPSQAGGNNPSNKERGEAKKHRPDGQTGGSGSSAGALSTEGRGALGRRGSSNMPGGKAKKSAVVQKKKNLLHEIAAKRYQKFLASQLAKGRTNWPPVSYYLRPRRRRKRPDFMSIENGVITMRVPKQGAVEGSHIHQFAPEWRKPMTVDPEQIAAFLKPGGGVIEPTADPPLELKTQGLLGQDLNQGYLTYIEPDTTSSTDEIMEMLDEASLEREEESAHFITYRNNLNKILTTPYSKQKWEMEVFKEGGVIHLEVVALDRNRGKMDRTSYWGRRFETLCVLGVDGARLDDQQRVPGDPPRPSYCGLYRSRLGGHSILMGAEIDAHRPMEPSRFVEIKTTKLIRDAKDEQIFKKHKCLKYWAQCYMAGVKDLVVGYRDDQGMVRDVKHWTTDAVVDSVDKIKHWDKDVCLNFADRCLSFFKDNVDEGVRYSVKHLDPYDTITMEPIIEPIETSDGTPGGASSMGRGVGDSGGNVVGLGVA